jgi:hypothetical protein
MDFYVAICYCIKIYVIECPNYFIDFAETDLLSVVLEWILR